MRKWTPVECMAIGKAVDNIELYDNSIYSQVKALRKRFPYRSWESIRSKINRRRKKVWG